MAIKGNQRVRTTKSLLQSALMLMLKEQDISHITVRSLTEKAGINRTTFYSHYSKPEDVLADIQQGIIAEIENTLSAAESSDPLAIDDQVTSFLQKLYDERYYASLLLDYDTSVWLDDQLCSLPVIKKLWQDTIPDLHENEEALTMAIHGSVRLIKNWLKEENPRPPEEEAALILRLARKVTGT